ncbi:putative trna nucleotidyltransferase protein [Eutypa lata UCREL1]|uniref:Putative trna nucleotidyltransferase protein n=1 Tax=Eutypa lata (strain UCR-EL1) TaxID=1287681 RepID=M7SC35_EUTLA|nr:putative trna nucleotidyltransferase protein [Eutypa lata UCREL1]
MENPMFEDLLKALGRLGITEPPSELPEEIQNLVPDEVTAQDAAQLLVSDSTSNPTDILGAFYVLLSSEHGVTVRDGNEEHRRAWNKIIEYVGDTILPILSIEPPEEEKSDTKLSSRTLISVAAFTNSGDAWTTTQSAELSEKLLEDHFRSQEKERVNDEEQLARFVAEDVLSDLLRPLFSKSRPATVTASGRKAEFVEPSRYDNASAEAEARKPWKYDRRYAVTVFEWAEQILQKSWHLFTPVLLTLLDEPQTALKVRALDMFRDFWSRCPGDLMRQTGLAQVFEDAVFPAVLYLPSLTPVEESVAILNAAYPALMVLVGINLELAANELCTEATTATFTQGQQKLLDRLVREGILVGYHHASEHVRIVELLCYQLRCIVNWMGILTVKYLKNLIPMVTEIMTEPFGTQYPPGLSSAIRLLQAILRTCWPRIPHYCNEIIKALMVCWLNVEEEEEGLFPSGGPDAAQLQGEMTKTAGMLAAVMKAADLDMDERVSPLIKTEPQLGKLFKLANSSSGGGSSHEV